MLNTLACTHSFHSFIHSLIHSFIHSGPWVNKQSRNVQVQVESDTPAFKFSFCDLGQLRQSPTLQSGGRNTTLRFWRVMTHAKGRLKVLVPNQCLDNTNFRAPLHIPSFIKTWLDSDVCFQSRWNNRAWIHCPLWKWSKNTWNNGL